MKEVALNFNSFKRIITLTSKVLHFGPCVLWLQAMILSVTGLLCVPLTRQACNLQGFYSLLGVAFPRAVSDGWIILLIRSLINSLFSERPFLITVTKTLFSPHSYASTAIRYSVFCCFFFLFPWHLLPWSSCLLVCLALPHWCFTLKVRSH